jgi:hypothetical protein
MLQKWAVRQFWPYSRLVRAAGNCGDGSMHSERHPSGGLPHIGIFVPARWEDVGIAAAAMLAIGIPFVAFANLVLFHFYARGSACRHCNRSRRSEPSGHRTSPSRRHPSGSIVRLANEVK